jgi:hypothetical protein
MKRKMVSVHRRMEENVCLKKTSEFFILYVWSGVKNLPPPTLPRMGVGGGGD